MSVELYANNASTTLAAEISTTNGTSITVASATGFPATGNFRILIGSELLIVTGVSGTTWTVVRGAEGTTAATHANGVPVIHIVTKDSIRGVFSHLYGTGFRQGLAASDWAWVNQSSATLTEGNGGGLSLYCPPVSGVNIRILKKAAPTPPYTITAVMNALMFTASSSGYFGIGWRQSSDGKLALLGIRYDNTLQSYKYTNETSFSATYTIATTAAFSMGANAPLVLRIRDDNTYRKVYISPNGIDFFEFHSVSRTDFLTADEVLFWANTQSTTYPVIVTLHAWEVE